MDAALYLTGHDQTLPTRHLQLAIQFFEYLTYGIILRQIKSGATLESFYSPGHKDEPHQGRRESVLQIGPTIAMH